MAVFNDVTDVTDAAICNIPESGVASTIVPATDEEDIKNSRSISVVEILERNVMAKK